MPRGTYVAQRQRIPRQNAAPGARGDRVARLHPVGRHDVRKVGVLRPGRASGGSGRLGRLLVLGQGDARRPVGVVLKAPHHAFRAVQGPHELDQPVQTPRAAACGTGE
jgi:hypothetical protein